MDAREAALRFRAGDRLQTAFLKKLPVVDAALVRELAVFLGEPKLGPRIVRLVPASHAKAFVDAALERWPTPDGLIWSNQTTSWAREHRYEAARQAMRALLDVADGRAKRALDFLQALLSSDEPDAAWGERVRAAVSHFGVSRVKDLATRIFEIAEGQTLPALL